MPVNWEPYVALGLACIAGIFGYGRLWGKVEDNTSNMFEIKEDCDKYREGCQHDLINRLDSIHDYIVKEFDDSKKDRKELRDSFHGMDVRLARMEQKTQNGNIHG